MREFDIPLEAYENFDMWWCDCPMCLLTAGGGTQQEAIESAFAHLCDEHMDELQKEVWGA
jgi:hypothetical protein